MQEIRPAAVRYLKLGAGGAWTRSAFERSEMYFGYASIPHELCAAGNWEAVSAQLLREGRTPTKASDAVREIRDFYTLGSDCLWITFAQGHLWWAFAEPEVYWLGETGEARGPRMRRVKGAWQKVSICGEPLRIDALSSKLTQVASYRQTICRVGAEAYLLRRINGQDEPLVQEAREVRAQMTCTASALIAGLHWADFETLVDLIFTRAGWQRLSRLGGTQADVDLVLKQPTTGERAFVQVKSRATQATLNEYLERFRASSAYDRFFFVCHSPAGELSAPADRLHIWDRNQLADAAVQAGLFDWLMDQST